MPEGRAQFLRFAAVGAGGFAADVLVLYAALFLGLGLYAGRALSFLAAVRFTWELNRRFTFARLNQGESATPASGVWWRYLLAMLGGGAVNYVVYGACILLLPAHPMTPLLSVGAGSLAGLAVNFAGAKLFVFRH